MLPNQTNNLPTDRQLDIKTNREKMKTEKVVLKHLSLRNTRQYSQHIHPNLQHTIK